MGRIPGNPANRKYQIQYLWAKHHEILRRHFLGHSNTRIARDLGVHFNTVSHAINNELAQEILERMRARCEDSIVDVKQRIMEATPEALGVILDTMEDETEDTKLRTKLAQDILDRAGLGATRKVQGEVAHVMFTPEDIVDMKKRIQAAKKPTARDFEKVAEEIQAEVVD